MTFKRRRDTTVLRGGSPDAALKFLSKHPEPAAAETTSIVVGSSAVAPPKTTTAAAGTGRLVRHALAQRRQADEANDGYSRRRAIERREILKYSGLTMAELGERHHAVLLEVGVSVQVRDDALGYESLKGRPAGKEKPKAGR